MKKIFQLISVAAMAIIFTGCGGGSDNSPATGTMSMNVTDAKAMLPQEIKKVLIQFDEVSVHKSGGGWVSATLAQGATLEIDLFQFSDGKTTQLVPPASLTAGKYTQVRIGVTKATIVDINNNSYPVEIPSENLKTEKNFEFTVQAGGAVDLTVDFDLSQSIVVTGTNTYQLKPVLHLVTTSEAWTIEGNIAPASFGNPSQDVTVVVYRDLGTVGMVDSSDEKYTALRVTKGGETEATSFSIFWLVPYENYYVEFYLGDPIPANFKDRKFAPIAGFTSRTYDLNGGNPLVF